MKKREQAIRTFTVAELKSEPREEAQQLIYSTPAESDCTIRIASNAFNLVLSRNVKANTSYAMEIAVDIAKNQPGRDVWYVNTYAGIGLMQKSIVDALKEAGLKKDAVLPNMRILDVPFGEWSSDELVEEIETNGRETAPPVVILNAFEFAAMTRGGRERLSRELIQMQSQFGMSVIVFSHEMHHTLVPGFAGRGPVGLLAPFSASINRINEPFEHLYGSFQPGKATVHEEKTHVSNAQPAPKAVIKVEKSEVERAMENIYERPSPLTGGRLVEMGTDLKTNGNGHAHNGNGHHKNGH